MSNDECCPEGFCIKCNKRGCMRTYFIKDIRDPDKKHGLQVSGCKEMVEEMMNDFNQYYGALNRIPTREELRSRKDEQ